jgi:hypothetical protein
MEWNTPNLDDVKTCGKTWFGDEYLDIAMPDVRKEWSSAKQNNTLGGCGLHKNFTYDDLCDLEESLFQRRLLADVQTPDVLEHYERLKKQTQFKSKRRFKPAEQPEEAREAEVSRDEIAKEIKEKLKAEVLKELLAELKGS